MVTEKTIIVEDRLTEMFSMLPPMNGFEVVFGCGDNKELQVFLKEKAADSDPYPLIWLVYPYVENHLRTKVELNKLTFILAVETNKSMLNKERIDETYKKILFPLLDNIKSLFTRANIMNVKDEYTIIKFPNYSGDDNDTLSSYTTANWDALKVTIDCTINNVCLRPITF